MITILLVIALSTPRTPVVEVCEINRTPVVYQVILWRWMWLPTGHSHHVSQWWIIRSKPDVRRQNGMWLVSSEGRRFIARSLRRTETWYDPEMLDQGNLATEDRKEYAVGP